MRSVRVVMVAAALVVGATGVAAAAPANDSFTADASTDQQQAGGSGVVGVSASEVRSGVGLSAASTGGQVCSYQPFLADTVVGVASPTEAPVRFVNGVRQELWAAICPDGIQPYWQSILSERQLLGELLDEARRVVPQPVPQFWPFETLTRWTWVRWPSYMWLDPEQTEPRTVTASTPGISVTASITATAMTFDLGDGQKLSCPGVTRRPTDEEILGEAGTSAKGACSFRYPKSSFGQPGDKYQATVDLDWRIAWTSSSGSSGAFPTMTTRSPVEIAVAKLQAINSGG